MITGPALGGDILTARWVHLGVRWRLNCFASGHILQESACISSPPPFPELLGGLGEGIHGSIRGEHNPKATCVDGEKDRTYLKVYLTVVC